MTAYLDGYSGVPEDAAAEILEKLMTHQQISSDEVSQILKRYGVCGEPEALQIAYRKKVGQRLIASLRDPYGRREVFSTGNTYVLVDCCNDRDALEHIHKKLDIGVRPVDHAGEPYTLGKWRFSDSIPCWTWPGCEGKNAELEIFSIGSEIELYQDGQLLARKPLEHGRADFTAIYRPGTLTAISYDAAGAVLGRVTLSTAGAETILQVLPEQDTVAPGAIAFVPIHLTDAAGTLKMTETRTICVQVHGGALVALGSAELVREPDYYGRTTAAWHGRALAVVRADGTGTIEITASADGLANATARICVK